MRVDSTTRILKIGYNNRSKFRALLKIIGSIYPMKNTEKTTDTTTEKDIALGNVYVMTHSFFSDVVKIGCTTEDPQEYAKSLSAKTIGEYSVVFSLQCNNPCKVKKTNKEILKRARIRQ